MYPGLVKQFFILLCLIGFVLAKTESCTSSKQSKNMNGPHSTFDKRFKESAPTLVMLFQHLSEFLLVFLQFLDSTLSILLCIMDNVVRCCTDILHCIFGVLFNLVKLLEVVGFIVKFILEINYSLVSYLLNTVNTLRGNVKHAINLVKMTVVNKTNHVYKASAMVLGKFQHFLFSTLWNRILVIWDSVQPHITATVDNVQKTNLTMITNATIATTRFFMESILVTSGVVQNGCLFFFSYIAGVFGELYVSLLAYMLLAFTSIFQGVTVVLEYLLYFIALPLHLLTNFIYKAMQLGYTSWLAFTNTCASLDKSTRQVIKGLFQSILGHTTFLITGTWNMINQSFPAGVYGFLVSILIILLLCIWRKNIVSLVRLVWEYLANMNRGIQQDDIEEMAEEEQAVQPTAAPTAIRAPAFMQQPETSTKKLMYELEKEKDKRLCVICQDNVKNVLLLPCKHVCLCNRCIQEIRHGHIRLVHCPLCRQRVESTMEVFV